MKFFVDVINETENVMILDGGIPGIYGKNLTLNAGFENEKRGQFIKLCKSFNENLRDSGDFRFSLVEKKKSDNSITFEFIGEQLDMVFQQTAIQFARELNVPVVIL